MHHQLRTEEQRVEQVAARSSPRNRFAAQAKFGLHAVPSFVAIDPRQISQVAAPQHDREQRQPKHVQRHNEPPKPPTVARQTNRMCRAGAFPAGIDRFDVARLALGMEASFRKMLGFSVRFTPRSRGKAIFFWKLSGIYRQVAKFANKMSMRSLRLHGDNSAATFGDAKTPHMTFRTDVTLVWVGTTNYWIASPLKSRAAIIRRGPRAPNRRRSRRSLFPRRIGRRRPAMQWLGRPPNCRRKHRCHGRVNRRLVGRRVGRCSLRLAVGRGAGTSRVRRAASGELDFANRRRPVGRIRCSQGKTDRWSAGRG